MFQRIMVATGGSPWSTHAVDTAIRLAGNLQQALLIVHVVQEEPQFQGQVLDASDPEVREQLEQSGTAILQAAAERASEAGIELRTELFWGEIPECIVRTAQSESCDLIVMGTRHISGDKRLMSGINCNAVLATAPCPVLVVPFSA